MSTKYIIKIETVFEFEAELESKDTYRLKKEAFDLWEKILEKKLQQQYLKRTEIDINKIYKED
ncbi:MAG: hypothetical protein ACFFDN_04850 [Candidatus Hodarchaeota archaeon]